ncbi:MAG: hypothetical protein QOC69_5135, partial [Mycobacterium sp.]|nr:hypothetical protein [Mycobacterium sp.]
MTTFTLFSPAAGNVFSAAGEMV